MVMLIKYFSLKNFKISMNLPVPLTVNLRNSWHSNFCSIDEIFLNEYNSLLNENFQK